MDLPLSLKKMESKDRRQLKDAFGRVKVDVRALETRLAALEGDIMRTIKVNLRELKDKLADGTISAHDARYKRILNWDLR